MNRKHCKVFISYAHDSDEHKESILQYSNELINPGGLDCWIDRYVEGAIIPDGWPNWMRTKINESDFVLVVCSPVYHARYEKSTDERGKGLGAKFESTLIINDFYQNDSLNRKFIPVIINNDHKSCILDILQNQTYYDISDPTRKEALYRLLTNQPLVVRPNISSTMLDLSNGEKDITDQPSIVAGSKIPKNITAQITKIAEMKPGTKILQAYFELPITTRFAIAAELGLLDEGESIESPDLDKLSASFLERAYNRNLLALLWSKLFDESIDPNPFKK